MRTIYEIYDKPTVAARNHGDLYGVTIIARHPLTGHQDCVEIEGSLDHIHDALETAITQLDALVLLQARERTGTRSIEDSVFDLVSRRLERESLTADSAVKSYLRVHPTTQWAEVRGAILNLISTGKLLVGPSWDLRLP